MYSALLPTGVSMDAQICFGGMSSGKYSMPWLKAPKMKKLPISTATEADTIKRRCRKANRSWPS